MNRRVGLVAALFCGSTFGLAAPTQAKAKFVFNSVDAANLGFNDPKPAEPVGGNKGRTLGEQRMNVFKAAGEKLGALIDSPVPIVVEASFAPLECVAAGTVLGQARSVGAVANANGLPPNTYFVQALADRLAGTDLNPGKPDIEAQFNGGLSTCASASTDWYYGLDGASGDLTDLQTTLIHELLHGLGFSSTVDLDTGMWLGNYPDVFSTHLLDTSTNRHWSDMTDAERLKSIGNVRHLVWDGENVTKAAAKRLAKGAPQLSVSPAVSGFSGLVGEANFGLLVSASGGVGGPLAPGVASDECSLLGTLTGKVVLLASQTCNPLQLVLSAEQAGAVGALWVDTYGVAPPNSIELNATMISQHPTKIPALAVSMADAQLLAKGSGLTVKMDAQSARLVGADEQGRVYLYSSSPTRSGSSISHWDPLVRPNLLMEPNDTQESIRDLTMELALLRDLGWTTPCGNGTLDDQEECDNGANNSDSTPGACRTSCVKAKCGDAVVDPGEECDDGRANSASAACSETCKKNASTGTSATSSTATSKTTSTSSSATSSTATSKTTSTADGKTETATNGSSGSGCTLGGRTHRTSIYALALAALLLIRTRLVIRRSRSR